jgi:hypothetical protein
MLRLLTTALTTKKLQQAKRASGIDKKQSTHVRVGSRRLARELELEASP